MAQMPDRTAPRSHFPLKYFITEILFDGLPVKVIVILTAFMLNYQYESQTPVSSWVPESIIRTSTSPWLLLIVTIVAGSYLVIRSSGIISRYSLNNWQSDSAFGPFDELVLVTGGCSGIGAAIARDFAKRLIRVVVWDIQPPQEALPSNVHYQKVNITSSTQIRFAAAALRAKHGEPTVLINNAGIGTVGSILGTPEDLIHRIFEIDTISHFSTVKEFLPAMVSKGEGHIISIGSLAGFVPGAGNVPYSCAKASTIAFHEGLAQELRLRFNAPRVRTTLITPAWTRTPMNAALWSRPDHNLTFANVEDISQAVVKQVFLGRSGDLVIPGHLGWLRGLRALPGWMRVYIWGLGGKQLDFVEYK